MILSSLLALLIAAFGFLRDLLSFAELALPVWIGLSIYFHISKAYHTTLDAGLVGLVLGWGTHIIGQIAYAKAPSALFAAGVGVIYSVPAAIAGYFFGIGMARLLFDTSVLQEISAILIAIFVFISCWRSLSRWGQFPIIRNPNPEDAGHTDLRYPIHPEANQHHSSYQV
ncbi:MAG: hypothetical protein ACKOEW_03290, partial [Methylocystis sp.]